MVRMLVKHIKRLKNKNPKLKIEGHLGFEIRIKYIVDHQFVM